MTTLILIACMIAAQTGTSYALRGQPVYTELPAATGGGYTLSAWTGPFGASTATLSVVDFIPPTDTFPLTSGSTFTVTHSIRLGSLLIGLLVLIKLTLLALYALFNSVTGWLAGGGTSGSEPGPAFDEPTGIPAPPRADDIDFIP